MLKDFLHFAEELLRLLHFARGVLLCLFCLFLLLTVGLIFAEAMPFGEAVYFAAITALTVGYGDVTPVTPLGQVLSVAIGFLGVIFVGISVAVANRALARALERRFPNVKPEDL